jgi:hypothetical protein
MMEEKILTIGKSMGVNLPPELKRKGWKKH